MSSFLYYCAGSDWQLLQRCGRWERFRHSAIGTFVILTGLLAFVSGGYALSTVFEDSLQLAISVAALWGFLIFSLDRFIVMAMAETSVWRRTVHALPRLLLAIFIALVVARPLELRIFEEEIEAEIARQQTGEIDSVVGQFGRQRAEVEHRLQEKIEKFEGTRVIQDSNRQIGELNVAVSDCRSHEQAALQASHAEIDGTGGSGRRGYGVIAKRKEAAHRQLVIQCSNLADQLERELLKRANQQEALEQTTSKWRAAAQDELTGIEAQREGRLAQLEDYPDSFLQRHRALGVLQRSDEGVNSAVLLITLLFVLVECSPVFSKLLTPPGHYEELLLSLKKDEEVVLRQLESERKVELERNVLEQEIKIGLIKESRVEIARKGRRILESWKEQAVPADLVHELEKSGQIVWSAAFSSSKKKAEGVGIEAGDGEPAASPESLSPEVRWLTLFMGVCLIAAASLFVWKWTLRVNLAMVAGLLAAAIVKGVSDYLSVATNRLVLVMGVCLVAASVFFMWQWTHQYNATFSAGLLVAGGTSWASDHWYKRREEQGEA